MKSYTQRQNDWIKENNLQVGDKVKVINFCGDGQHGWGNAWSRNMHKFVGLVHTVESISLWWGIELNNGAGDTYYFPYFILEKVNEEKKPKPDSRESMVGKEYTYMCNTGKRVKVIAVDKEFAWCEVVNGSCLITVKIKDLKGIKEEFAAGDRVARKAGKQDFGTIVNIVREYAFIDWDDGDVSMNKIINLISAE